MAKAQKRQRQRTSGRGGGCVFLLLSSLFAGTMLIVNGVLISIVYPLFMRFGPSIIGDPRIRQGAMFVGPILLLVLQWWVIDRYVDWRDRRVAQENGATRK